jgi:hypothetical protein
MSTDRVSRYRGLKFCAVLLLAPQLLAVGQGWAGWFDRKPASPDDTSCQCMNCGENDHYQHCVQQCRKQCKSTWYPRVAPYCQPGWGWTQPCWRRAEDTYNCPPLPPSPTASPRKPYFVPEAPATEEAPNLPAPQGTASARR